MSLRDTLDALKRRAAEEAAKRAFDKAADGVLDDLETALLGKPGASSEILGHEVDPLEKLRAQHGLGPATSTKSAPATSAPAPSTTPAADAREAREAKARADLAELKRKLGKT